MKTWKMGMLAASVLVQACLAAQPSPAFAETTPALDFNAQVQYRSGGKTTHVCGSASSCNGFSRLDIDLKKTGTLSVLVDSRAMKAMVLARKLKSYVEVPLSGDPRNWRDILKSISAVVAPQSMGMVDLAIVKSTPLGKGTWQGYPVNKSRVVLEAVFMGSRRNVTLDVWENGGFAPFPLRASAAETRDTYGGTAWLANIEASDGDESGYSVPRGYSRMPSVMDLVLYALAAF